MTRRSTLNTASRGDLSARLRRIAGWALIVICSVHIALFAVLSRDVAAGWLLGDFRTGSGTLASEALFWALPGGFPLPMLVLASLILWLTRRGVAVPGFVGYGLTLWTVINIVIVPASGFGTALIPCALLIWADVRDRRRRSAGGDAGPAVGSEVSAVQASRPTTS